MFRRAPPLWGILRGPWGSHEYPLMLNTPLSPWPLFSDEEIKAVQSVLASNRVNYWSGEEGRKFEEEFAAWCGAKHAVALANGTIALELALKALSIGPGDEVVVTPRTFIASISCVVSVGATPVFADVECDSGNLTAETITKALTPRTKAVICVHLAGWPCDMDPIMDLAARHGLKVIEDCAQAHGARYKGRSVGTIGHIGAWSFCQDKIMTTGGEGGMVTTNDDLLWSHLWSLKDHGKSWEAVYERRHPEGFRWLHESFGGNGRMLEVQAVIGRIQLQQMSEWTATRNRHASAIWDACRPHAAARVPEFRCGIACVDGCAKRSGCVHAFYKVYVYINPAKLADGWSRDRVLKEITAAGVPCYQGSCPEVYLEKAFDGTGWRPAARLPVAQELGETSLMFLVHPTLRDHEIARTCEVASHVLREASI
jgi:dTDP-4-amino-4,6-dideoxygalactose transaminase